MGPKGAPNLGSGALSQEKIENETKMLISGHFSGYSELHNIHFMHIIYAHVMYMIAL